MPRLQGTILFATVLVLAISPAVEAEFYISEFMASNHVTLADEDGDYPDWIEIYNAGPAAADLDGYYLTDDAATPAKWRLPSTPLPAGSYLVVFASGKNRALSGSELHTNFKLNAGGEYLALVEPDGVTVAHEYAPEYPAQTSDVSYGLSSDLVSERCFVSPTPGAANDESLPCASVADLVFSHDRGFYDAPFDLTISTATAGAQIYYTLDGSEPTEQSGILYGGPIHIGGTTIVRAAGFLAPLQPTPAVSHTYIFLDDVLIQNGAGLPSTWDDYDMDPTIVFDPAYHDRLIAGLTSIPTISIVTDMDNLFGAQDGIYVHPNDRGIAWERPASVEFIRADGGDEMQVNCGIRIQGGGGRGTKKKSFRLAFKAIYGPAELDFPLFEDSDVEHFDKIRLRAGYNKSWAYGEKRSTYIRDQWMRDTLNEMGVPSSHGTFVHLYLNGLYWGLYNAVEKPDESFAAAHFGGDKDDWDIIKAGSVDHGTKDAWNTANEIARAGVADQAGYDALAALVDIDNLTRYMIANFYAGTTDWDQHNWFAGRLNAPGNTFKFFAWDAEYSLDNYKADRTKLKVYDKPSAMLWALRQNPEYRVFFGDLVHRFLFNDGALTKDRAFGRYMERAREIDTALIAESARWGDAIRSTPLTRDRDWLAEVQFHRQVFFPRRGGKFLEQLREAELYPLVEAPSFNQAGGDFEPGFAVAMTAPAGTIYYTMDGSDPRQPGGAVSPSAMVYGAPIALASSVEVKARALVGSDWSALARATFVLSTPIRITEIMYNPPEGSDLEYVEFKNIGSAPLDVGGLTFVAGVHVTLPSYVLPPGGYGLIVRNQTAFETRYGTGLPVVAQYTGRLSNVGDRVRLEDAGGYAIQDFYYDDVWYPTTDGGGNALVIRDPSGDKTLWDEAEGWRPSTYAGGSPGIAETPLCADGNDNDGDGFTDYPADPGCVDASADIEDPECNDGIDNDGDGLVDTADPECPAPSGARELIDPIDGFVCYSTRTMKGEPKFVTQTVSVSDPFDGARTFSAREPKQLCLPASIDGAAVEDPDTALQNYRIKPDKNDPDHTRQSDYFIEALGPLNLDTVKPDSVFVPTAVSETAPVGAPDDGVHRVDHFKCYRIRLPKGTKRYFPRSVQVHAADGFEDRRYDLKKPFKMCLAASFEGGIVKDPGGHLMCYIVRRAKGEPAHTPRLGVYTNNELGPRRVDTREPREICVPARRSDPSVL